MDTTTENLNATEIAVRINEYMNSVSKTKVAISGKMCSGKSSVAVELMKLIPEVQMYSLASPLKKYCTEIFDMKEKDRKLLQDFGTFVTDRKPDAWLKMTPNYTHTVIDDLRLIKEANYLKENGFVLVRLNVSSEVQEERIKELYKDCFETHLERRIHKTETELDSFENFDIVFGKQLTTSGEYTIFTDGSCLKNSGDNPAGWACIILLNGELIETLNGPVVTDAKSLYYFGAEVGTNNTAELSAIVHALKWVIKQNNSFPVTIRPDSTYCINHVLGKTKAHKNVELVGCMQSLVKQVKDQRKFDCIHVKAHSKHKWNDMADHYAKLGTNVTLNFHE